MAFNKYNMNIDIKKYPIFRSWDIITNGYLSIKNRLLILLSIKPKQFKTNLTLNQSIDFSKLKSIDDDYRKGQPWGDFHPDKLLEWYDHNGINLTERGLEFSVTTNKKDVVVKDKAATIPFGVGLVVSKRSYIYGVFEWNVTLPSGVGLWPAVWLGGKKTWPPEIDVIEAYSDNNGDWGKRLNTNVHLGDKNENHYQVGGMRHGSYIKTTELKLTLEWTEKFIKIYYNDYLVRKITNKYDLSWFKDVEQVIILNTALNPEWVNADTNYNDLSKSPFIVKDFKYYTISTI